MFHAGKKNRPRLIARARSLRTIGRQCRLGAAVVEMAILLPLLVLCFLLAADFARIYYFSLTLQNCARAGALYAYDPASASESPFSNVTEAAQSDAANLNPKPTITQTGGTDASGRAYVVVSAAYTFSPMASFPPIPKQVNLTRTVRMYVAASKPNAN
jgi:Flp pilus assembly protein TadG